ncbi:hypothetical protein GCM10025782_36580 [Pedococcus ginsenosidimutans]|uniref:YdhG-like domain-containing protein n=2 Tax=Pedococcus ginsenosidimutans TaxID=490570 RepID=A0ABP8YPN3_9MICO
MNDHAPGIWPSPGVASTLAAMTADEVDAYLAGLEEPKRSTLEALRRSIRAVVPDAEECISYGMPAFRVEGKVVAGFAAFKHHLAYLPHSGTVLAGLSDALTAYERTSGSLHFPVDEPLPDELVRSLVEAKLATLRS